MCSLLRSLILFPLASVFGCGFGGSGDVFGKVSLNGKPLTAGTVVIVGADKLPYTGKIGESGAYAIEKVPSGPAKISVVSPSPEMDRQPAQLDRESPFAKKNAKFNSKNEKASLENWFSIPEIYAEPETSGLTLTVRSGANTFDITLTGESPAKK